MTNSGSIVDGLVICRPRLPRMFGGGNDGDVNFFILSKDEKIEKIKGKNCVFDNGYGVGKLTFTIKTSNGTRQIGPIGNSEIGGRDNTFTITDLDRIHNFTDEFTTTGKWLGPPRFKNPPRILKRKMY